MKTKKTFDCIKMVREIRDRIYEENKNKSQQEMIEYYAKVKQETLALREDSATYKTTDQ